MVVLGALAVKEMPAIAGRQPFDTTLLITYNGIYIG